MARQQLGLAEDARAALDVLREIMREASMVDDRGSHAFLREAEELIAAD